ncbi:histidine phosphatase family protein [Chitinophaga cymbidii]|uniref:histidine phosphatase family protein n=1 Tax=Chitinophaga cymbidii TaxID=1096750 RepID=UPI0011BD811B|nr:histidine phosphatase family protein [Chitinophaga cymbidii]
MSKIILFLLLMWSAAHAGAATHPGNTFQAGPGFPESSITTFIFIHCAETTGNDEKLSATGHEQAGALTAFLSDMEVAAVYAPFKNCLVETVQPLASAQRRKVEYFRDATTEAPDAMKHILDVMMEKHKGKTIVICAPAASIKVMAGMLGIKEKALKTGRGTFNEVLLVNVWWFGEAVAQKLNMNFQKKV